MKFTVQIDSEGAAIADSPEYAIGNALRKVTEHVESGRLDGVILDDNGNTIGSFTYNED